MIKPAFCFAVALVSAAPAIAFAQSASHMVPGEGYRIPAVTRTTAQSMVGHQIDPSLPGDGYRIAAVPRTNKQPLAGYYVDPSVPGDGYRMNTVRP